MVDYMYVKQKIFPLKHTNEIKFFLNADSGQTTKGGTMVPILMQDEGRGDPNSIYTNPESASFSEYQGPNTFPDSKVYFAKANVELALNKSVYSTDNVNTLKIIVFPIMTSFLENLTAKDEVSTLEVEDILELQHETTDRQAYPLWNGTKLSGTHLETGADVPGLTTNTNIEGVTFDMNTIYDSLQFYTNGGKVRHTVGKMKTLYLNRDRILRLQYRIKSKAKRQNPYTSFNVGFYLPDEASFNQLTVGGDLTSGNHVVAKVAYRYNEYNPNFNFMR